GMGNASESDPPVRTVMVPPVAGPRARGSIISRLPLSISAGPVNKRFGVGIANVLAPILVSLNGRGLGPVPASLMAPVNTKRLPGSPPTDVSPVNRMGPDQVTFVKPPAAEFEMPTLCKAPAPTVCAGPTPIKFRALLDGTVKWLYGWCAIGSGLATGSPSW